LDHRHRAEVRKQLLAKAEQVRSSAKITSTAPANDFVEGCLSPPRSPYETQCLPQSDAARRNPRVVKLVREHLDQLRETAS
jgi:hypothetical protein